MKKFFESPFGKFAVVVVAVAIGAAVYDRALSPGLDKVLGTS